MKNILRSFIYILFTLIICSSEQLMPQNPVLYDPVVDQVSSGIYQFLEGPVWMNNRLLFSDIPANSVYQWTEAKGSSLFLQPSGKSNGLALDLKGRLLLAQHGKRQLAVLLENQTDSSLVNEFDGKKLNSPNDLTVRSDGAIYFTDPPYGISSGQEELGYSGIFLFTSEGDLKLLDSSLNRPNGIALSPDESILYVSDSEARNIYVWDVNEDSISNKKLFAHIDPSGNADGMKTDQNGFLYATGPGGIWIYHPDGTHMQTIPVPGQVTNCGWGAPDDTVLFVTTNSSVHRITNRIAKPSSFQNKNNKTGFQIIPSIFTEFTKISIILKSDSYVNLSIYDEAGRSVQTLISNYLSYGKHDLIWYPRYLSSGNYFVQIKVDKDYQVVRCIKLSN